MKKPTTDFDHNTEKFARDPWGKYAELRESSPVAYSEAHGGFWVVSRYDDVVAVATDDVTFSSVPTTVIPDSGVYNLIPLQSDPPDLQRYRTALLPYFTPKAVTAYEPKIRAFTTRCIDAFIGRGKCELVTEFANPVPSMTALSFIGFDPADWRDFADPIHKLSFAAGGSDERAQALADLEQLDERVREAIAERREQPQEDAISHLIQYRKNGNAFSDLELHGLVKMLLFGGLDTTMAAMSNALLFLSEHPTHKLQLIDDKARIPAAVDEFLRFEAPVHAFSRTATKDTEIGGQTIRAGEQVYMLWASANRDASKFDLPDVVDFSRKPNRHLTFGVGGTSLSGCPASAS